MSIALSRHLAQIAEAKDHLGDVPENLRGGLARYFELGIEPGRFLCAVLENDLMGATVRCSGADDLVDGSLRKLALFLFNHAPSRSYGSKASRLAWQAETQALNAEAEAHDTERPPAPSVELPDLEVGRG